MIPISGQPVSLETPLETSFGCQCKEDDYCALYKADDFYTLQFKAEPCSGELLCNPEFETEELITNGGFIGGTSGWTLDPAAWVYTLNAVRCFDGGDMMHDAPVPFVAGKKYIVSFKIFNFASGQLQISDFIDNILAPTTVADGIYSILFIPSANASNLIFVGFGGSDFEITDISITELPECWTTGESLDWSFADGFACHQAGGTASLIETELIILEGRYKVTITISGSTAGSITLDLAGTTEVVNGNETFTRFIGTGRQGDFKITPSSEFNGCVSQPSIIRYPDLEDYEIAIFDKDGNYAGALNTFNGYNPYLYFDNEFVTLFWDIAQGDIDGNPIPEGCYTLCVNELCDRAFSLIDVNTQGAYYTVESNKITYSPDGAIVPTFIDWSPTIVPNCPYFIKITFGVIDNDFLGTDITVDLGNDSGSFTLDSGMQEDSVIVALFPTGGLDSLRIHFDSSVTPGAIIEILEVKLALWSGCYWIDADKDFCSNCFQVAQDYLCADGSQSTVGIAAKCNEPALGFNFKPGINIGEFIFFSRVLVKFSNPIGQGDNKNYKLSDGSYYKYYAERDKVFDLVFVGLDETAHDAINILLLCDELYIENDIAQGLSNRFVWLESEYKPEWDKKGELKKVDSRIQIRRQSGHLTNSNCV